MRLVLAITAALLITACGRRDPDMRLGCGGSPPEDSRDYAKWKAKQDASCKPPANTLKGRAN
jgi:hypothetical protein